MAAEAVQNFLEKSLGSSDRFVDEDLAIGANDFLTGIIESVVDETGDIGISARDGDSFVDACG